MGFFDFFKSPDINEGVKQFEQTQGAVLLDVRTEGEYLGGHVPHSKNIPLDKISTAKNYIPSNDTPVFAYCLSGARSSQAVSQLKRMGYTNVTNIGGIGSYRGQVEA